LVHFDAHSDFVAVQPETAPGADLAAVHSALAAVHSVFAAEQPETAPGAALAEQSVLVEQLEPHDFSDDTAPGAALAAQQPFSLETAPGAVVDWVLLQPTMKAANERAAKVARVFMRETPLRLSACDGRVPRNTRE
jgi:hypothetical protein